MGQAYKIDRINLITYKCQRKKILKSTQYRYLAKSQVVKCNAQSQSFDFTNFRGSHFKKVRFQNAIFHGCDFWGTTFNSCDFQNARFEDCIFMACKFKKCNFTKANFSYCTIVNTNVSDCLNIDISTGVTRYNVYPQCTITPELEVALKTLKNNYNLKKNKLLFISNTKYNQLNLFLLQNRYYDKLPELLLKLAKQSTSKITTYAKLKQVLNYLSKVDTI